MLHRTVHSEGPMTAVPAAALQSPELVSTVREAADAVAELLDEATRRIRALVIVDGRLSPERFEAEQHAAHGLAWLATYVTAIRELAAYAERLSAEGRLGEIEELLVRVGAGEYLEQVFGGIPMSQTEFVRLSTLGLPMQDAARFRTPAVETLIASGNTTAHRARLASLLRERGSGAIFGDPGLDDTLEAIRSEMHRFGEAEVVPHAHEWHLENAYIPLEIISKMADLGVFGLTIPEEFGGMGLSKVSMCVVSEELSRAYIGVGSLGTRSEIAAELILGGGTDDQKTRFLPGIGRNPSDGRFHGAEYRLGSGLFAYAGGAQRRCLPCPWQQDLDHASGPGGSHDHARAHEP
jgi:(2S)-methylsuccinyl-CoA dehydrogenase